jgi:hypothetical protein
VVFHPFRVGSRRWNRAGSTEGKRHGCAAFGPHFHIIGFGWLDHERVRTLHARDGWVVRGLGPCRSVRETALYLLSHAGRAEPPPPSGNPAIEQPTRKRSPFAVVTWFGELSYNRLYCPPRLVEGRYCPVCELLVPLGEWFRLIWSGSGPPPEGSGVADHASWRGEAIDRTGSRSEWVTVLVF